jgi:hypothetical protein
MDFHTRAHSNHRRRPNETDMALQHVLTATAAVTAVIDNEQRLFTTVAVQFASLVNARYGALGILSENGTLRDSLRTALRTMTKHSYDLRHQSVTGSLAHCSPRVGPSVSTT